MSDTTTMAEMQGNKECNYCLGMGCLHCLGKGTVPVTPHRVWPTPTDLADAQLELDVERVERALEWERAKEQVKRRKKALETSMKPDAPWAPALMRLQTQRLLAALDELERLEEAGGGL